MDIELKNLKGTYDYLPSEQKIRDTIVSVLKETFELYGYSPLETPILCYYELLSYKYGGGAEILKEVYKLKDQGNRDIGLRYDLTVPFTKVIGMNKDLRMPFRRYEIGKVFRDGPVKTGRNREFTQCDVDVVGIEDVISEVEFMNISVDVFKKLGIDIYIEWNNRKLLSGLIKEAKIDDSVVGNVITSVDKLLKIGEDSVKRELNSFGINDDSIDYLFSLFKLNLDELNEKLKESHIPILLEGLKEATELNDYLKYLNLDGYTKFTPNLARGLDIYTGTIWEVFSKNSSIKSSIGGGGRYDKIITEFISDGNVYPALGMSFGLDVIFEVLNEVNKDELNSLVDVLIIPLNTKKESLLLAKTLRESGVKVEVDMSNNKLKKVLNYANKQNIPYVIIYGEDEVNKNELNIKEMNTGNTLICNINQLDEFIKIIV